MTAAPGIEKVSRMSALSGYGCGESCTTAPGDAAACSKVIDARKASEASARSSAAASGGIRGTPAASRSHARGACSTHRKGSSDASAACDSMSRETSLAQSASFESCSRRQPRTPSWAAGSSIALRVPSSRAAPSPSSRCARAAFCGTNVSSSTAGSSAAARSAGCAAASSSTIGRRDSSSSSSVQSEWRLPKWACCAAPSRWR
mmetsp:Transcript_5337/g.15761  ORF Transcript_5337/g.15761 Transcript_5337/m.15761 type:complete len:204 (+) Transcript_5337:389-1000(+)